MQRMTKLCYWHLAVLGIGVFSGELRAQTTDRAAPTSRGQQQPKNVAAARAAEAPDANSWYDQARRHTARGNLELAIAAYEQFLQQADIQRDAQEQLQLLRQQLEQKQLLEKLERRYNNGRAALNARDWPRAVVEFEALTRHKSNFRDTDKRLLEAQNKLAGENVESMAVRLYALGMSALSWHELEEAHIAFATVQRLLPDYRDTRTLLTRVENLRTQAANNNAAATADSLVRMAQNAASQNDWMQAVIAYEALRLVRPNDRAVSERLAEARSALAMAQSATNAGATSNSDFSFAQLGGLAMLVAVPLLGWLYFAPDVRARRLLLRQDYRSAARVYETELTRHPSRVKYFPKLAEIYLREGRKDDEAMKVYRNVLQLNLAASHREEINAVVAQQYLQEGRTDADAIEVLEKQLEAEIQRQNQSRALVKT